MDTSVISGKKAKENSEESKGHQDIKKSIGKEKYHRYLMPF